MLNDYTVMGITLIIMFGFIFAMMGYMFYEIIKDIIETYKRSNRIKLNIARREQLINEMKAGTFNEEKARAMINELYDVIHEASYAHVYQTFIEMSKRNSGIYQLTKLVVDHVSWI